MVHISCTWQNNDSSSSPTVITCNCSKAIYWGRGGTRGKSAIKIIRGEGGVLGAPGDLLAKESTGESWSPHSFHTQSGERTAAPPWLQGRTDGGDIRGVWVKERGGRATPQESENRAWHPSGTRHHVPSPELLRGSAALRGTSKNLVSADACKSQGDITH